MEEQNKNGNIIAFRVDPYKKQLLQDQASKNNMKISEYCKNVLLDNLDQTMLLDSQKKLAKRKAKIEAVILEALFTGECSAFTLIEILKKQNFDITVGELIGIETIILQNDMTYKYFDIPQTRSELNTHLVNHPITEVAREQVLKNIRELRSQKDNVDEQK